MNRTLVIVVLVVTMAVAAFGQDREAQVKEFFKAYDAAFNAKDMTKLATLYHKDVTIFEGTGINRGWIDYRDNHLGPEMKSFENLQWAQTNLVIHILGDTSAYVTTDYAIKYKVGERQVDSGGIATHVLVKEDGVWKIRHSQTAARRAPPRGGGLR